jgi:hypothetical protein
MRLLLAIVTFTVNQFESFEAFHVKVVEVVEYLGTDMDLVGWTSQIQPNSPSTPLSLYKSYNGTSSLENGR